MSSAQGQVREQLKTITSLAIGIFDPLSDLIIDSSGKLANILLAISTKAEVIEAKTEKRVAAGRVSVNTIIPIMRLL